ncbi:hypothetical protein EJ08DRAFT_611089 [Tothia fuscella]|uniref:Uncharacterized protein n=1 Tax=Tothia fuscella TaxID=1048955 RepID=A0A9P4NSB1_9PEZI|nr:hypothetical protein EJ08DRAFT_611089 [Tothia fuscella]
MATTAVPSAFPVSESKPQPSLPSETHVTEKALPTPPESFTDAPTPPQKDAPTPPEKDCRCDVPASSTTSKEKRNSTDSAAVLNSIPTAAELAKVGEMTLLDAEGREHTFKSIYDDPSVDRHLIIFVRHFFCTVCQEYLRTLSDSITPSTISSLQPSTKLTIIGCGSPDLVKSYIKETHLLYPIYTDPTSALYKSLHLGNTLAMGNKKPQYLSKKSMWQTVVAGVYQSLSAGRRIFKAGDWTQIGGEFLFTRERSSGNGEKKGECKVEWCHRMTNTRDHAEVEDLRKLLGVEG